MAACMKPFHKSSVVSVVALTEETVVEQMELTRLLSRHHNDANVTVFKNKPGLLIPRQ
jgi:hypothetical protein